MARGHADHSKIVMVGLDPTIRSGGNLRSRAGGDPRIKSEDDEKRAVAAHMR